MNKRYSNIDEIISEMRREADNGNIRSASWLSLIFYAVAWGRQDDELALKYSLIAAHAGNSTAMCRAAVLYTEGSATERDRFARAKQSDNPLKGYLKELYKDFDHAEQWINEAATDPDWSFAHAVLSDCKNGECFINAVQKRTEQLDTIPALSYV